MPSHQETIVESTSPSHSQPLTPPLSHSQVAIVESTSGATPALLSLARTKKTDTNKEGAL